MAFDIERDWPIVAAGAAGVLGLVMLARSRGEVVGQRPVAIGVSGLAEYYGAAASAVQAQTALQGQMFSALVGGLVERERAMALTKAAEYEYLARSKAAEYEYLVRKEQTAALVEAARLEASLREREIQAQLEAARMQAAAQQQQATLGFLGGILGAIIGLFCWQTTSQATERQALQNMRAPVLPVKHPRPLAAVV